MLDQARLLAADFLVQHGQEADARIVRQGGGDDFPEVRLALALQKTHAAQLQRYERALRTYADGAFWDAEIAEAALAYHDQGAVARAALDGKELFALHRD
ncbi:MAG TPA: hypothetical protein VKQ27_21280 [Acetobacteraceae bacterium]|nr:hypothetical protein [Acetobacteraceae bacterium]